MESLQVQYFYETGFLLSNQILLSLMRCVKTLLRRSTSKNSSLAVLSTEAKNYQRKITRHTNEGEVCYKKRYSHLMMSKMPRK